MRQIAVLKNHWPVVVVLLIYVAVATAHSVVVPLAQGNDEWAHFLYARFIAEHGRLPINLVERQNQDEVGTKSDDPPLYHLLVAATGSGIEPTRLLRPVNGLPGRQLADNFVVSYAFLVHTAYENFPYQGEVLLWYVGRYMSILFGAIIILLTYMTGFELFPFYKKRALIAAALVAFIPAFIFHSSVMTYDGLGAIFTALFLLTAIKAIKQPASWRWWLILGFLAGLAVTTKYTSVLLPLEIIFIAWLTFKKMKPRATITRLLVAGIAMVLATSWWFGFVIWHFNTIETQGPIIGLLEPLLVRGGNDSTAITVTAWLFGEEAVSIGPPGPPKERNYPQLAQTMIESFWSMPIAEQFLLSPWLTAVFAVAAFVGVIGLGRVWQKSGPQQRTWLVLLLFHVLLTTPLILIRIAISFDPLEAVQGRHILFPAASAIPVLLVWGWSQWRYNLSRIFVAGLLLWSAVGQLGWAALVYPEPLPVWTEAEPVPDNSRFVPVSERWQAALQLSGVTWQVVPAAPGLEVRLRWKSQAVMFEDYLVELTLLDEAGDLAGYSLGHPLQGRYPTRAWEPGDVVQDIHWLPLVGQFEGVYQLQLRLLDQAAQPLPADKAVLLGEVGLTTRTARMEPCATWAQGKFNYGGPLIQPYRLRSTLAVIGPELPKLVSVEPGFRERFPLVSANNLHIFVVGPDWAPAYQLFVGADKCHTIDVSLPPRNFTLPNIPSPLVTDFNNEVRLLGYELPTRRIQPGQRLPLTLYWQALAYVGQDYQIFDNLLDDGQQRWGGYDRRAQDGYSTLLWTPGEIIIDRFGVPVDPAAPPGIYTLDIGLYRQAGHEAESLFLFADGQPTGQNSLRLGPIKVGGPPQAVIVDNPTPQIHLSQRFGEQIVLLGYDLAGSNNQPISLSAEAKESTPRFSASSHLSALHLNLYWQAETIPATDYTTFLHLRDDANETVVQKDQPPTNGLYPTSLWDTGEIIIDEIVLPLENVPPGEYTPVIGLYDFSTGARLSVAGSFENELRLERVLLP